MASGGGEVDTPCGEEIDMASCGGVPVKFHPNKCFKFLRRKSGTGKDERLAILLLNEASQLAKLLL